MPGDRVRTWERTPAGAALVREDATFADASLSLPPGAYTTFRTYGGRAVVRLETHLRRLEESIALQGRPAPLGTEGARRALLAALREADLPEARVRLTFSPPALYVSVARFAPPPAGLYERGAACATLRLRRPNPHAKDTRFVATVQEAYRRLPPGVEEGLLVAEDGAILEGLSSNFFAVLEGALHTEDARALAGTTRGLVLEVARGRLPLVLRAARTSELGRMSEAFLTSVSREVLPVTRIDGEPVGSGDVGPHTRAIRAAFADLVRREAEPLLPTAGGG
jgi:branched-chain amino acid aminotransferase